MVNILTGGGGNKRTEGDQRKPNTPSPYSRKSDGTYAQKVVAKLQGAFLTLDYRMAESWGRLSGEGSKPIWAGEKRSRTSQEAGAKFPG